MTFTKFLKIHQRKKGQASLEYFILFTIMVSLTLVGFRVFIPKVRQTAYKEFEDNSDRIRNADRLWVGQAIDRFGDCFSELDGVGGLERFRTCFQYGVRGKK